MKSKTQFAAAVSIFGTLALGASACKNSGGHRPNPEHTEVGGGCVSEPSPAPTSASGGTVTIGGGCFEDRFVRAQATKAQALDLLFVTDTSGSLTDERGRIADGIDQFIRHIPAGTDLQIAVMLAHGSRSPHSGKLYKHANHPYVLSTKTMSLSEIRTHLRSNMTQLVMDDYGGGEEGLYSLSRGLVGGGLSSSRAHGFFREQGALAVVFVSDENDICSPVPSDITWITRQQTETDAYRRDCAGINADSVLSQIKAVQGDRPFLVGAITYTNWANVPRNGYDSLGYGYLDIVQKSGGVAVDIAGDNLEEGLRRIGDLATIKMYPQQDFVLSNHGVVDDNTIRVSVQNIDTQSFTYANDTRTVHLTDADLVGSQVNVNYCVQPIVAPSPEPSTTPSATPSPEPSTTPSPDPTSSPVPGDGGTGGTGTGQTGQSGQSGVTGGTGGSTPAPSPTPSSTPCTGLGCDGGVFGS